MMKVFWKFFLRLRPGQRQRDWETLSQLLNELTGMRENNKSAEAILTFEKIIAGLLEFDRKNSRVGKHLKYGYRQAMELIISDEKVIFAKTKMGDYRIFIGDQPSVKVAEAYYHLDMGSVISVMREKVKSLRPK